MAEAQNFVEKEMEKILETPESTSKEPQIQPTYTPPVRTFSPETKDVPPTRDVFNFPPQSLTPQEPTIQIVEKIVYKKQRIHGFFRTLTIMALLAIGFLMLGESTGTITLSVNSFKLHQIFPIFIIFSSIIIRSYKWIFGKIFGLILFMTVFGWIFTMGIYTSLNPSSKRTSGNDINYTLPETKTWATNMYISTLIENALIKGSSETGTEIIKWTRQSERSLLVLSGNNDKERYIKLNEDSNRNILQNYLSKIDLVLPQKTTFDLFYIKNLLWIQTINLDTFQRKTFKFDAGINDITINIGNVLSGNTIDIQGAAANVNLNIPKDVAVTMYYKHLVGIFKTSNFDVLSWHYLQSQNTSGAKATLNIYVNLGVGNTKINRVDAK